MVRSSGEAAEGIVDSPGKRSAVAGVAGIADDGSHAASGGNLRNQIRDVVA